MTVTEFLKHQSYHPALVMLPMTAGLQSILQSVDVHA